MTQAPAQGGPRKVCKFPHPGTVPCEVMTGSVQQLLRLQLQPPSPAAWNVGPSLKVDPTFYCCHLPGSPWTRASHRVGTVFLFFARVNKKNDTIPFYPTPVSSGQFHFHMLIEFWGSGLRC